MWFVSYSEFVNFAFTCSNSFLILTYIHGKYRDLCWHRDGPANKLTLPVHFFQEVPVLRAAHPGQRPGPDVDAGRLPRGGVHQLRGAGGAVDPVGPGVPDRPAGPGLSQDDQVPVPRLRLVRRHTEGGRALHPAAERPQREDLRVPVVLDGAAVLRDGGGAPVQVAAGRHAHAQVRWLAFVILTGSRGFVEERRCKRADIHLVIFQYSQKKTVVHLPLQGDLERPFIPLYLWN